MVFQRTVTILIAMRRLIVGWPLSAEDSHMGENVVVDCTFAQSICISETKGGLSFVTGVVLQNQENHSHPNPIIPSGPISK